MYQVYCKSNWQKRAIARLVLRMHGTLPNALQGWSDTKLPYPNNVAQPEYPWVTIRVSSTGKVEMCGYRTEQHLDKYAFKKFIPMLHVLNSIRKGRGDI